MYGVPSNIIAAVISRESGGNPRAKSPRGAVGMMQLMPGTAREMGVSDPSSPWQNVMGGTRYLASLLQRYRGNLTLALAAYNAGPAAVDAAGGVPNIPETQTYVRSVLGRIYGQ